MSDNIIKFCYVCGFEFSKSKCFDEMKYPFFDCPCCFFEYGIEEFEYNVYESKRKEWIENGAKFAVLECSPYINGWNIDNALLQLSNLEKINVNDPDLLRFNPNFNCSFNLEELIAKWNKKN